MPNITASLPPHGKLACRSCFTDSAASKESGQWKITNDPGAWGSSDPKYLVLGFSKGFTQASAYTSGPFETVAFAKFRPRVKSVLVQLGLLDDKADIDALMTAAEKDWAFCSLVRCSLCRKDSNGNWAATGPLVKKAFVEQPAKYYVKNCTERFLTNLPERLKAIVLLGNDDGYIAGVREAIRHIHPDSFEQINSMAYRAGGVTWVHAAHPSGSNGEGVQNSVSA